MFNKLEEGDQSNLSCDYLKSNRSICKKCDKKLDKSQLRFQISFNQLKFDKIFL